MANKDTKNYNSKYEPATAPFNFVRLPRIAVDRYNSKEELPAHNRIYREEEGYYSGEITYEVVVDGNDPGSVLMIGDDSPGNEKHFFRNNEGKCTIPGSTIRGMVRSNVQILGMCNPKEDIQNSRFMYRDVASKDKTRKNEQYGSIVIVGDGEYEEGKVQAGYIRLDEDEKYRIYPTKIVNGHSYFRIKESDVREDIGSDKDKSGNGVHYMYNDYGYRRKNDSFTPYFLKDVYYSTESGGSVTKISLRDSLMYQGTLMTSGFMNKKKTHYILNELDEYGNVIELSNDDVNIYQDDLNRKKQLSEDVKGFYELPTNESECKPVFYTRCNGKTYFGMTPYLRIYYDKSVHDGIPEKLNTHGVNYADALFGFANAEEKALGYRSRLSFEDVVSEDAKLGKPRFVILAEPKATCYPEYLMTENEKPVSYSAESIKIRGIKQYWLTKRIKKSPENTNENIGVTVYPVESGRFKGKIHYENLTEDELGLVLYALYLKEDAYQSIGMGKPYGYGRVKIENLHVIAYDFDAMYAEVNGKENRERNVEKEIQSFKLYMEDRIEHPIENEINVKELLYIKTHLIDSRKTDYLRIDAPNPKEKGKTLNEFTQNIILPEILKYESEISKKMNKNKHTKKDVQKSDRTLTNVEREMLKARAKSSK